MTHTQGVQLYLCLLHLYLGFRIQCLGFDDDDDVDDDLHTSHSSSICVNNHTRCPFSQHNHSNKLLIASIVQHITWFQHKITIQTSLKHQPTQHNKEPTSIHKNITQEAYKRKSHKIQICRKWLSNEEVHHKLSKYFWKTPQITDAKITQLLKFQFAQYTCNHRKDLFQPHTHTNPNCTLCQMNNIDTWSHLLSLCNNIFS